MTSVGMRSKRLILKYVLLLLSSFVLIGVIVSRGFTTTCIKSANIKTDRDYNVKSVNSSLLLHSVQSRTYYTFQNKPPTELCLHSATRELRLSRDILDQVVDDGLLVRTSSLIGEDTRFEPGDIPSAAHYVWCGNKIFRFEDYLGVLSIVRVMKPMKLVFHYNSLFKDVTRYHTWFDELTQSLPSLILQHTDRALNCNTTDSLNYALEQLAASGSGGTYFGERTIMTYIPEQWKHVAYGTYALPGANSSEQMIVFARHGIKNQSYTLEKFKADVISSSFECATVELFNEAMTSRQVNLGERVSPCLALKGPLYPENIINNSSPFGKVSRMLYYGRPETIHAQQTKDPELFIPSISHMISLDNEDNKIVNWTFSSYLSVLSALYIGGFQRVYIHSNQIPVGKWWEKLQQEDVKFVQIDKADTVFANRVQVLAHQSDILRSYILLKYGGVYQDKDVFWTSPPPQHVMRYPAVICYDWPRYDEWPRSINLGIIMARRGAPFLRKFLEHLWYYDDHSWGFNGIMMPYKMYERHPDTAYIYTRLQVICFYEVCHPTWQNDYMRSFNDASKPTAPFGMNDTMTLHFTVPKIPLNMTFDAIKKGDNVFSKWGQFLIEKLEKAEKWNLLDRKT